MITIYDHSGKERYTTEINKGCKRKFMMMTEDYITLKFSDASVINFDLGDYVEIGSLPNGAKRFELTSLYSPKYNQKTGGYDYEVRFDAYYWKWKNRKIKYRPDYGANESSFSLASTPDVHLSVLLKNLEVIGWTYYETGEVFTCKIDDNIKQKNIALTYSNVSIIDALTEIAKACEAEWWVDGSVIRLGEMRVNTNSVQTLSLENGALQSLERRENNNTFATRIYPFGSTRNLSARYRKTLSFVKNAGSTNTLDDPFGNGSKGYYLFADITKPIRLGYFSPSNIIDPSFDEIDTVWSDYDSAYSSATIDCTGGFYILDLSGVSIEHGAGDVSVSVNDSVLWSVTDAEANTANISVELPVMVRSNEYANIRVQINTPSADMHKVSGNIKLKRQKYGQTKVSYSGYDFDAYIYPNTNNKVSDTVDNLDCLVWVRDTLHTLPADGTAFTLHGLVGGKIPESYFSSENDQELSLGIFQQNLLLPKDKGSYIDVKEGLDDSQIVEEIIVWDDIYPEAKGTVSKAEITTEKDNEGNEVPVYTFESRNVVNFDTEVYILQGQQLHIVFDAGSKLGGLDFEVAVLSSDSMGTTFRLIPNENYGGITIPNSTQFTEEGDTFSMYGIDASILDDTAISIAEQNLYTRAQAYIEKISKDTANYDGKLMADYAYEHSFQAGEVVNVKSSQFFKTETDNTRESRIVGFEYPLDIPYDNPVYTIGEGTTYSRLGEIESKLNDLKFAGKTYTPVSGGTGGSSVYIIKTNDDTEPTDSNVFSAKRTSEKFLSIEEFARLFKLVKGKNGSEYIHTPYPFASDGAISTKGVGKSEDGEQVSYDRLDEWPVEWDESLNGYVLSAKLGQDLRERIETLEETKGEEDGIAGEDDKNFVYTQGSPSDTWVIEHNLNKYPSVTVIDSAYSVVLGDVRYDSLNQVTLMFAGEFSGQATLN